VKVVVYFEERGRVDRSVTKADHAVPAGASLEDLDVEALVESDWPPAEDNSVAEACVAALGHCSLCAAWSCWEFDVATADRMEGYLILNVPDVEILVD